VNVYYYDKRYIEWIVCRTLIWCMYVGKHARNSRYGNAECTAVHIGCTQHKISYLSDIAARVWMGAITHNDWVKSIYHGRSSRLPRRYCIPKHTGMTVLQRWGHTLDTPACCQTSFLARDTKPQEPNSTGSCNTCNIPNCLDM
jgi:hypothetical protein